MSEQDDLSPKKKESPSPLTRAVDTGAEVRPLSPVRRFGPPLAVAAALALAAGSSAYAMSHREKLTTTVHPSTLRSVDVAVAIAPSADQPRLAGEVAPPMASATPSAAPSTAVAGTPTPSASVQVTTPSHPIVPQNPPRPMPGGMRPPSHDPSGNTI